MRREHRAGSAGGQARAEGRSVCAPHERCPTHRRCHSGAAAATHLQLPPRSGTDHVLAPPAPRAGREPAPCNPVRRSQETVPRRGGRFCVLEGTGRRSAGAVGQFLRTSEARALCAADSGAQLARWVRCVLERSALAPERRRPVGGPLGYPRLAWPASALRDRTVLQPVSPISPRRRTLPSLEIPWSVWRRRKHDASHKAASRGRLLEPGRARSDCVARTRREAYLR